METKSPPRVNKYNTVTLTKGIPYVVGTIGAKVVEFHVRTATVYKIERTLEENPDTATWATVKAAISPAVGDVLTFAVGAAQFWRITATSAAANISLGTAVDYIHIPLPLSKYRTIDLDETEEEVKATAATLHALHAINRTASPLYLRFYDATAATVSVGTTTPAFTLTVPGNNDSDGAGFIWPIPDEGIAFDTAMCIAATTGIADNDTGAPGTNDLAVNLAYR